MTLYHSKMYQDLDIATIRAEMGKQGYTAERIEEGPGAVYDAHVVPNDLLLVYLHGSANVKIGNQEFECTAGDKLQIPGNAIRSSKIGDQGVVYLMTELELSGD